MNQTQKLFPSGEHKFFGFKGGKDEPGVGMTVIEYLSALNRGQDIACLSRQEFVNRMLGSTTGMAHTRQPLGRLLRSSFVNNFGDRRTAEEAKLFLGTYKADKPSNLTRIIADIMNLSGRASTTILLALPDRQCTIWRAYRPSSTVSPLSLPT